LYKLITDKIHCCHFDVSSSSLKNIHIAELPFTQFYVCLGIPALVPVVEDVFLVRGTSSTSSFDLKELDTQREVLVSMLLRLVEYHQVSSLSD
jgi:hypothetical protein